MSGNSEESSVCLLCNSDQVHLKHKGNYRSRVSSQVIAICTKYLPEEITGKMNAVIEKQILEAIDAPIFCYFCFENSWILSKLNSQLEEIQSQINKHVSVMILQTNEEKEKMKISLERSTYDKTEDSSIDSSDEIVIPDSEPISNPDNVTPVICVAKSTEKSDSSTEKYNRINRCGYCSKAFTCPNNLSRHIESTHHNKLEHTCGKCGMEFQRSSQLIIHTVNIHNDSRSLLCGTCGKSFSHLNELQNHKVLEHSKKHKCRDCGQSFEHLIHLQDHLRTHDNVVTKFIPQSVITAPKSYQCKEEIPDYTDNPSDTFSCWVDEEAEITQEEIHGIKIEIDDSIEFKVEPDDN